MLDMDEVLTDFVGGVCRLWGVTKPALEATWPVGTWGMVAPLQALTSFSQEKTPAGQERDFWLRIEGCPGFWEGLETLPWADEVVDLVAGLVGDNWRVVTAPSRDVDCYTQKVRWLKRKFGWRFDRFHVTPHKHDLAKPGVVLVDDRESNVASFTGGTGAEGVLFPTYHNALHALRADPLAFVRAELEALKGGR